MPPLPFQLPLRRNRRSVANRIESYFCRSAVAGQPISVMVIVQTPSTASTERPVFPPIPFSRATATVATERNYGNRGQRYNGAAERQRNGGNHASVSLHGRTADTSGL